VQGLELGAERAVRVLGDKSCGPQKRRHEEDFRTDVSPRPSEKPWRARSGRRLYGSSRAFGNRVIRAMSRRVVAAELLALFSGLIMGPAAHPRAVPAVLHRGDAWPFTCGSTQRPPSSGSPRSPPAPRTVISRAEGVRSDSGEHLGDSCGCAMSARFLAATLLASLAWYAWHWHSSVPSMWAVCARLMASVLAAIAGKILGILLFRFPARSRRLAEKSS
jgi:hypothetical protein